MSIRPQDSFNQDLTDTFAIMRISKRQKLVGSASVTGNIITNDYDLNEMVDYSGNEPKIKNKILNIFRQKFLKIHSSTDTWIIDFKCGKRYGEPIRWSTQDLVSGTNPMGVKFVDCILQQSRCKLDVVQLLNGRFVEISEIYYFNINGKTNYNEDEFKLPNIIHELETDRNELLRDGNVFKAMKREYRILTLLDRGSNRRNKLSNIFNGPLGWLYYCISNLSTLVEMKQQDFRSVPHEIFYSVQQTIKDDIARVMTYPKSNSVLNGSASVKDLEKIIAHLMKQLTLALNNNIGN